MDKYYPDGDKANSNNAYAYVESQAMMQVLKQCGDDLTRENVMKQAANLKNFTSDMLLPGIAVVPSGAGVARCRSAIQTCPWESVYSGPPQLTRYI